MLKGSKKEKGTKKKPPKRDPLLYYSIDHPDDYTTEAKEKNTIIITCYQYIKSLVQRFSLHINTLREERLTIMFIPHNENKIKNFHISNLALTLIISSIVLIIIINSILIIHHSSTVQEVDKLKSAQKDTRIQFSKIREEINSIGKTYYDLKENLSKIDSLSKGQHYQPSNDYTLNNDDESKHQQIIPNTPSNHSPMVYMDPNITKEIEVVPNEIFMLDRIIYDMLKSKNILNNLEAFIKKRTRSIQNTPTLWPVYGYIVNPYGLIRKANELTAVFNAGVDIISGPGAEVVATAAGQIVDIKQEIDHSWSIRIRHNYGYETIYKGLARLLVQKNKDKAIQINKGDPIGYLGMSFNSNESILHYQIFIGSETQKPLPYMNYITD